MKFRLFLLTLSAMLFTMVSAQIESGKVYRIKNAKYSTYAQEDINSHTVVCDKKNSAKYNQLWQLNEQDGKYSLRNVQTGWYLQPQESMEISFYTLSGDEFFFTVAKNEKFTNYYNIGSAIKKELYMSCSTTGKVVPYFKATTESSVTSTEWSFEEVEVTQEEIDAARDEYNGFLNLKQNKQALYKQFSKIFKDKICSELLDAYAAMTDEQMREALAGFPVQLINIALKVKNNNWAEYEKEFRVAQYTPYSKALDWAGYMRTNAYSELNSPTGITCKQGDALLIFVDQQVYLPAVLTLNEVKGSNAMSSTSTYLYEGLNVVTASHDCTLFITYQVETSRDESSKKIDDFSKVGIHIQGGTLNGYFDKSRHTNEDWVKMLNTIMKNEIVNVKGDYTLFHMHRDKVVPVCPDNIYESISGWDTIVRWELELMGGMPYRDRWNNLMLCCDGEGSYMFATAYYTYYEYSTLPDILPWEKVRNNPGYVWGPAHEIGHMNQGAINIVSCTEVSNNLFANMVVQKLGKTTTRGMKVEQCITDWTNKVPFPLRSEVFSKTRMYYQLYMYFHEAGHDTTFYPRLFEYLRETQLSGTSSVNAKFNQLRFAEACCEIAQMDMSEFFDAWGFFEPMNNAHVGDYGDYYVFLTEEDAEASRARMQKYEKKCGHLMFLDDRVKPSKRGDGVDGYRLDWNSEVPVGTAGDVGQWEDYIDHSVKAEGYVFNITSRNVTIVANEGARGAVGFKAYDKDGKMVAWSNKYKFTLPTGYTANNVTIVAAQADGTNYVIPTYAYGNEEQQLAALQTSMSRAKTYLDMSSDDDRYAGYYTAEATATLREIYDAAALAIANKDQSTHTYGEWSIMMDEETDKLLAMENAYIDIDTESYYTMYNVFSKTNGLTEKNGKLVTTKVGETPDSDPGKQWRFTAVNGGYIIESGNGNYITAITEGTQITTSPDKSNAAVFTKERLTSGAFSFAAKNNAGIAIGYQSSNRTVVGYATGKNQSRWTLLKVVNETGINDIEQETQEDIIYDLTGRKVETPTRGIYIINGKKTIIK